MRNTRSAAYADSCIRPVHAPTRPAVDRLDGPTQVAGEKFGSGERVVAGLDGNAVGGLSASVYDQLS